MGKISYEPLFRTMAAKGISSYRLQNMDFNHSTHYSIKTDKSISPNTVAQLCQLLECRVEDILEYVDEK